MWFWREVVDDIPLSPESFKILHPEIIHKTGQVLQKYTLKQGNVCSSKYVFVNKTAGLCFHYVLKNLQKCGAHLNNLTLISLVKDDPIS